MSDSMSKQLTIDRLREQLTQAELDRDTLAAEVRAWREVWESRSEDWRVSWETTKRLETVESATDASGALTRAKEDK